MGLGVYLNFGSEKKPDYEKLCEAHVVKVLNKESVVRLYGDCDWERITTQRNSVHLISK
jgi:hypothetical protein